MQLIWEMSWTEDRNVLFTDVEVAKAVGLKRFQTEESPDIIVHWRIAAQIQLIGLGDLPVWELVYTHQFVPHFNHQKQRTTGYTVFPTAVAETAEEGIPFAR